MKIYRVNPSNLEDFYTSLGTEVAGAKILASKSKINTIMIKALHTGAANILKQDALSIGADLAVPRGTILNETPTVDVVLIASDKHLKVLAKKELSQPFGLKKVAHELESFINQKQPKTKIMGILNANDDSFFEGSRFLGDDAIAKIEEMIENGADIIDIGAVSTRPNSAIVEADEELSRIKPICDAIKGKKLYEKVIFSVDSFTPSVIEYALQSGFTIINDITGLENDEVCLLAKKYDASVVIMHMQGTPQTMQKNPTYEDVIAEVDEFFNQRIEKAKSFGIKDIILDVGIGFGKTLEHNLLLLQNLEHFRRFGYEVLLGASRKSLIEMIVPNTPTSERLSGTLAIHLDGIKKGASIIRCHDVKEHFAAIKVQEAINNI
ncbi:MAG: dihydropteroate synthase [Arcobacteraceae bacterium]|nr:dihydropteroate synthase [Arcobacteraceae bacterium]